MAIVLAGWAAALGAASAAEPPPGDAPLAFKQLPGFSIGVPAGQVAEETTGYQSGKLTLRTTGARGVVSVAWDGGAATREDLELAVKALSSALPGARARFETLPGPGGASVDTAVVSAGMRVSIVGCGARRVVLVTAVEPAMDGLHRRMLPTIACRPDPKREATAVRALPLRMELPGWKAVDRSDGQLLLSDGRSFLVLRPGVVSSHGQFNVAARAVLGAILSEPETTPAGAEAVDVTGTLEGNRVFGWARQLRCRQDGVFLVLLAPDRATARRLGAVADAARCTRPGERGQEWPDAKD